MKKLIVLLVALSAGSIMSFGQCDKKVILTSSKTEYLGADSSVQRSEDEITTVEFDKNTITIIPGSDDHRMAGKITAYTCNWPVLFKEGKTVIKVVLSDVSGENKNLTITITGKGGKVNLLAEIDDTPDKKIHLLADKFEAKN